MEVSPALVTCPDRLWRVGRSPDPMNFAGITPEDASLPTGGNRFDVPGGGVLYAASHATGAFAETLARFRPTTKMRRLPIDGDDHLMMPGSVPADWRTRRQLANFSLDEPLSRTRQMASRLYRFRLRVHLN